jgi:class 3 adenylate cyclase/predicted ATPase
MKFCGECTAALSIVCPRCSFENPSGFKFCGQCTAALDAKATPKAQESGAITPHAIVDSGEGERKIVSALFVDLKGSTELLESLDPEEGRAIVEPLLRIMSDAVRRYEGYLVRTTGDGVFALFGAPIAYEDHPQRALYAALQMQQELRTYARDQVAQRRQTLDARVGVHTGEVVAYAGEASGKVEYRLIGHTANLASRMETIAPAGGIVVSEYTAKLCQGYFELRSLGPTKVKGLSEPVEAYEVIGPGALRTHFELSARRGLTRFVGRTRELEQIERALAQAIDGHGQVVAVVAEAGTGKSRLFYEFKATVPVGCKVLEAYSVSHGKASAWLPVLQLLRGYFGIAEADDAVARREKLRATLTGLNLPLEDTLPYLFGLLGIHDGLDPHAQMDPRIKLQRTLEAIKRILLRDTLNQPLVVIFEDLHWIDEQTQALLDLLADSIASARVLLLFNYRPEYRHAWTNKSYYTQLRLDPLGNDDGAAMLTALLGEGMELNPLKRLIAERTGGNPFFIEEIVQALFEDGALVRNGSIKVTRSVSQMRLPPTVQGMLAARIDKLPAGQKELLQTLAVVGRESPLGLLRQVVFDSSAQLEQALGELRSAEFIYEQPAAGDNEYVFKHALTQEVAYNSLLIERRKQLHERVGQVIEKLYPNQLEDHVATLAHHYSHSDNVEQAIEYLGRAGLQAIRRSANAEAINNLTAAIDLLRTTPDNIDRIKQELPLQIALGQAFTVLKGWAAVELEQAYTRALEICNQLGSPAEAFFALYGLYVMYHVRGLYRPARERAHQLLEQAERTTNPTMLLLAHYALGLTLLHTGELQGAREHQEVALSLYNQERDAPLAFQIGTNPRQGMLSYAGWTLWHLGYPDQAITKGQEALAVAEAVSHPNSIASARFFDTIVHSLRREPEAVLASAEIVAAYSAKHGLGAWLLYTPQQRGLALAEQGHYEEGIAEMVQSQAISHAVGGDIGKTQGLSDLGKAYISAGRLDEALDTVTEALDYVERLNERFVEAELLRIRGELALRRAGPDADDARNSFERTIAIAQGQSAKSQELRATTSLARLLASQGRRDEARMRLAEIYNWFTEGFDTADLKDAKSLLDELCAGAG